MDREICDVTLDSLQSQIHFTVAYLVFLLIIIFKLVLIVYEVFKIQVTFFILTLLSASRHNSSSLSPSAADDSNFVSSAATFRIF